ncbi:Golgin subfamily A member 5 [Brachionus plicatilis]|uniref:Golgin subfamily A member 5 n=1 Tax=Brachionus plicatilis TaxID=10195 RepID=A0A3M7SD15_BRAPC|nr:Golgin subfamily A member 5 [Brachionus plicatilis]
MNYLKQEFEEYKLKATKTLQSKDRLIATLKENASHNSEDGQNSGLSVKSIEIDELKLERDSLKEDLERKNSSLEVLRSEFIDLESQTSIEIDYLKEQIRDLHEQNEGAQQTKTDLELDLKNLRQELNFTHEELSKQKTNLNSKLQDRGAEIEKLRSQLTTKNMGTTTEKELENRLHLLTENLIQKQTLIEALQSEKHSTFLQLERAEKRLQDYENIVSSRKATTIRMHDDEEAISTRYQLLRESPYDHEVTRKMKRAASEIDKFSIRLGVFLKKYPIARIFVIFYMFLLHLWVIIVLFTYKPEIHDQSYYPPVMPHQ